MRNRFTPQACKAAIHLLVLLLTLNVAYAAVTVGELSQLQSETILLKSKLQKMTLQAELAAKANLKSNREIVDTPVVQGVYGVGKEHYAIFLYGSGEAIEAKVGDLLLGGFKVISINVNRVLLSKRGQRVFAKFSATPPFTQTNSSALPTSQSFEIPSSLPAALKYP